VLLVIIVLLLVVLVAALLAQQTQIAPRYALAQEAAVLLLVQLHAHQRIHAEVVVHLAAVQTIPLKLR